MDDNTKKNSNNIFPSDILSELLDKYLSKSLKDTICDELNSKLLECNNKETIIDASLNNIDNSNNLIPIQKEENKKNKKNILVLSGGGTKGIALIGGLKYLYENNIIENLKCIAGTSIGGFIGALLNIGYTIDELLEFMKLFDLEKLKEPNQNLFTKMGLDDGSRLEHVLSKMFKAKGFSKHITLKELYDKTKIKLIIVGTCLNTQDATYFSYENFPNLQVIKAIRITTSVPIYFTPVIYDNKMYVDGGCIDNFPIHLFDNEIDNVMGFYIKNQRQNIELDKLHNFVDYFSSILESFSDYFCNLSTRNYIKNCVIINLDNIGIIDTNITFEQKINVFNTGYNITKEFFN